MLMENNLDTHYTKVVTKIVTPWIGKSADALHAAWGQPLTVRPANECTIHEYLHEVDPLPGKTIPINVLIWFEVCKKEIVKAWIPIT